MHLPSHNSPCFPLPFSIFTSGICKQALIFLLISCAELWYRLFPFLLKKWEQNCRTVLTVWECYFMVVLGKGVCLPHLIKQNNVIFQKYLEIKKIDFGKVIRMSNFAPAICINFIQPQTRRLETEIRFAYGDVSKKPGLG